MAKGTGPGEIAPTMGSKNGRCVFLFRCAEFGYVPDTLLK